MKKEKQVPLHVRPLMGRLVANVIQTASDSDIALTYGDVRLVTGHSNVLPRMAAVRSRFSRRIPLVIPLASAAMDTVTESAMAGEIAWLGGIGVIHKNLTVEAQAREVAKVKHRVHGIIRTPVTVRPHTLVASLLADCERKGYAFRTFPVVGKGGKLVGLVSGRDIALRDTCPKMRVRDIMSRRLVTVPKGTTPVEALATMRRRNKKVLPVVGKGNRFAGLYLFSDVNRVVNGGSTANLDEHGQLYVAAAVGVDRSHLKRAKALAAEGVNAFVIDTAHGDTDACCRMIRTLKRLYPHIDVVAGNVSEPDSAWRLAEAGADAIKVGQGPGSICTTRKVAGVGCPQVTAVWNCARAIAADFPDVPIIADGGITASGDLTIALAVGASCVMVGQMLAGSDESPGEDHYASGQRFKKYRGMGSIGAMRLNAERYGQVGVAPDKLVPEGVEGLVPYSGPLQKSVTKLIGGLRSGMGYMGAAAIADISRLARCRRLTVAGKAESDSHSLAGTLG